MKTRCCCSKRYLLVFSILLVSVGSIFMSVSLSSCSSPSVKNPLLLCADSLMETYPDSQGKRTSANCLIINSSLLFSKLI